MTAEAIRNGPDLSETGNQAFDARDTKRRGTSQLHGYQGSLRLVKIFRALRILLGLEKELAYQTG